MRTITPQLAALLRSRFQAGGSGYFGRVAVYGLPGDPVDTTGVRSDAEVARYAFDDAVGSATAVDDVAAHNGVVSGDALFNGCSLRVSGSEDSDFASSSDASLAPNTAGTICAWKSQPTSASASVRDSSGADDDPGWLLVSRNSGGVTLNEIIYRVGGTEVATGVSVSLLSTRLTHYALTWDATGSSLYIDGAKVHDGPPPGAAAILLPWRFGKNGSLDQWAPGRIADFRVFNARLGDDDIAEIAAGASPCDAPLASSESYAPVRLSINKNRRMGPDQASIEFTNEDLAFGFGPTSVLITNSRIDVFQWFGDPLNEVRTFKGVIDKIDDARAPLTTAISCRSMAGPILVDQTFGTTAPQGADESGAARTEANGVYLSREVDYIVGDILERSGWPSDLIDVAATSFVLDEFIRQDGESGWDSLVRLSGLVAFDLWDDEDGFIHFRPLGDSASVDDTLTPDYQYEIGVGL